MRVLRCTHPADSHCEATRALGVDSCDVHSNRTGSVTETIKPANFLKLNHPVMLQLSARLVKCFNSLQTGKHSQSSLMRQFAPLVRRISFNSLQTGKHSQRSHRDTGFRPKLQVSIPFKRESLYKGWLCSLALNIAKDVSIPFKRERLYKG